MINFILVFGSLTETTFTSYPFPKKLNVVMKLGHYRVYDANNQTEDIAAQNAKEALTKCTLQNISKIVYLGFIDKVILSRSETQVDENNTQELTSDERVVEPTSGESNQPTDNTETST